MKRRTTTTQRRHQQRPRRILTLQALIGRLETFWAQQGCALVQPYDQEVGAGTFHPATFFGALGPAPARVAYVQPSRRPADGRYGDNPHRLQRYYQYQVLLKPDPADVQDLYVRSLAAIGIRLPDHDLRFVEDDWESPTLGAWGLGWEVWLDSLEVTQFTYFQQVGGVDVQPTCCEITYGLERLGMFVQDRYNVFDLAYGPSATYGDMHLEQERQQSRYNFELADTVLYRAWFDQHEGESHQLLDAGLWLPAYEQLLKCSHIFNVLDARGAVSAMERPALIARVRGMAKRAAETYVAQYADTTT